jgi:hypothetical protein
MLMTLWSRNSIHETEEDRLVVMPNPTRPAGFEVARGRTLFLLSEIRADSVGIASREDRQVPPTSPRPATVARRCGPRGQQ